MNITNAPHNSIHMWFSAPLYWLPGGPCAPSQCLALKNSLPIVPRQFLSGPSNCPVKWFKPLELRSRGHKNCPQNALVVRVLERQDRGKNRPAAICVPRGKQMSRWALWVSNRQRARSLRTRPHTRVTLITVGVFITETTISRASTLGERSSF